MKKRIFALGIMSLVFILASCSSKGNDNNQKDIQIYTRDASSGTREAFEKAVDFEGKLDKRANEVSSNDDMAAKIGSSDQGIGYASLTTNFEKNNVRPVKFENVSASSKSVIDGTYKLQRPFNFVTRSENDFDSNDQQQLVQAFIDYIQNSEEGLSVIKKAGGEVDLNNSVAWDELAVKYPVLNKNNSQLTLKIAGSTSVDKTIKAALESFTVMAGNVKFTMNQSGSGDAIPRVLGSEKDGPNKADIGFASREFKTDGSEDISNAMLSGQYCKDAVVVIVNKSNKDLKNFTKQQLYDIFTGKVTKWDAIK